MSYLLIKMCDTTDVHLLNSEKIFIHSTFLSYFESKGNNDMVDDLKSDDTIYVTVK